MPDPEDISAEDNSEGQQAEPVADEQQSEEPEENQPVTTVERTGTCECVIRIEADVDYLRERYQNELTSLQREITLPGFRRGRAPVGLVERRMGSTLKSDLISSVLTEAYEKAVDENDLDIVAQVEAPDPEEIQWEPGQPAQFEFRCEVMPEVQVQESHYKGLRVEAPALEVDDELLEHEMGRFAQQFATWEEVKDTGIDWDDYVEAEVSLAEDPDWSETIGFYPRAERVGPFSVKGVKAALVGAQVGGHVELEAELLKDEASAREELEPLADKTVNVRLNLSRVMRRHIPELDDDLAEKIGLSSASEIEPLVRERLQSSLSDQREDIARQMLVNQLLKNVDCELPASLVERAVEEHRIRTLVRLLRQGVPRHEAERRALDRPHETQEQIQRRLKARYLLRKIAEGERILVTESEVDSQIRAFATRQSWREERARSYMEERGMVRALRDDMRENKTIDFLMENAHVEEISSDEFLKRYGGQDQGQEADSAEEG